MRRLADFLRREPIFGVALFALLVGAQTGKAALVLCSTGPTIDLVNNGCYAPGNDDLASVFTAIMQATGTAPVNLTLYGKSDANPSLFSFTPNPPGGAFSGTWSVLSSTLISYLYGEGRTAVCRLPAFAASELRFVDNGWSHGGKRQPAGSLSSEFLDRWRGRATGARDSGSLDLRLGRLGPHPFGLAASPPTRLTFPRTIRAAPGGGSLVLGEVRAARRWSDPRWGVAVPEPAPPAAPGQSGARPSAGEAG